MKETGQCIVESPEILFDTDYPDHYMRRIKSVSLTIPCVTEHYTSINWTLTLYGYERNLWTGATLWEVIARRFEVQLKDSRIYELLFELKLSYQRAHCDYANADPKAQKEWVEAVKQTAIAATG